MRGTPQQAVAGLAPDVIVGANARACAEKPLEPPLEWIHRTDADGDWYFVSANGPDGFRGEVGFRATGTVRLWDPVTGTVAPVPVVAAANGRTTLAFDFASGESAFVVFGKTDDEKVASSTAAAAPDASAPIGCWSVSFPPGWGAPERLELADLKSWTELPLGEEGRHFSGTATYRTTLRRGAAGTATLDLGRVETVATVFVNGRKARTLWAPPYRCAVELVAGANELRVEVANTWFNRLVYDAGRPEAQRKTWTIGAPKKGAPLEPSGLLGPVTVSLPHDR